MYYIDLETEFDKRYDAAKFIEYTNDCFDILTSYFVSKLKSLSQYSIFVVQAEENRPDLISYKIYKDTQYWWMLMIYNDIVNFEEIPTGTQIKYPSVTDVEDLYFSLKSLERSQS